VVYPYESRWLDTVDLGKRLSLLLAAGQLGGEIRDGPRIDIAIFRDDYADATFDCGSTPIGDGH
jgi:hypothetical protein